MLSFLIIVVVSLLPFISTWISSPQEIFLEEVGRKEKKNIFKKRTSWTLTKKGKVFLGIACLTIIIAWIQFKDNQRSTQELRTQLILRDSINRNELRVRDRQARKEQTFKDSLANESLRTRDSLANVRIEKGKNETILALAQYSFKYDSSQKTIEKLVRDSSKTRIVMPIDPVFQPCASEEIEFIDSTNSVFKFRINYCSYGASSSNHEIVVYTGYIDSLNEGYFTYFEKRDAISKEESIAEGSDYRGYFFTPKMNSTGLI